MANNKIGGIVIGNDFTYFDNKYRIKFYDKYNYIDINLKKIYHDMTTKMIICE